MNHCSDASRRLKREVGNLTECGCLDTPAIHFARVVLGMPAAGLSCPACEDALPEQVEAELNNCPGPNYRAVRHHLDFCPTCTATYLALIEISAHSEEAGLPEPERPVDISFLKRPSGRTTNAKR